MKTAILLLLSDDQQSATADRRLWKGFMPSADDDCHADPTWSAAGINL
jgi:hypothetical protein